MPGKHILFFWNEPLFSTFFFWITKFRQEHWHLECLEYVRCPLTVANVCHTEGLSGSSVFPLLKRPHRNLRNQ